MLLAYLPGDRPIELKPDTVDRVVWAACSLLRKTAPSHHVSQQAVDRKDFNTGDVTPGEWRQNTNILHPVTRLGSNNASQIAKGIRQAYMKYFTEENTQPWQWEKLGLKRQKTMFSNIVCICDVLAVL